MLQFLLLQMPDTAVQIFSSGSLAGNAQAWLQCHCSLTQAGTKGKRKVKRINFDAGSRRRRGSPGWCHPALLSVRVFLKVTTCSVSELALSPDNQTLRKMGADSRPWHSILSLEMSPANFTSHSLSWCSLFFLFFPKHPSASKGRTPQQCCLPLHCPGAILLPDIRFPIAKPSEHSAVPKHFSPHTVLQGVPTFRVGDLTSNAFPYLNQNPSRKTNCYLGHSL